MREKTLRQWIVHRRAGRRVRDDLAERARWQDMDTPDGDRRAAGQSLTCPVCGETWDSSCLHDEASDRHLRDRGLPPDTRSADYAATVAAVETEFAEVGCRALELAFGPSDWCRRGERQAAGEGEGRQRAAGIDLGRRSSGART